MKALFAVQEFLPQTFKKVYIKFDFQENAFSKNWLLADSFIESRCPYIYLSIYLSPFHVFFLRGIRQVSGLAWNKTGFWGVIRQAQPSATRPSYA